MKFIRLEVKDKTYYSNSEKVNVFNNLTLNFEKEGFYSIVGESGCGKSTLLNILGLKDFNYTGSMCIGNSNVKELNNKQLDSLRFREISYIFQNSQLIDNLSVLDNIKIAIMNTKIDYNRLCEILKEVNLNIRLKQNVNSLSGGEKQRLSIAIALLRESQILLCDEVTGNLDPENSKKIFKLLKDISKRKLVILVSHDFENCKKYCDIVYNLEDKCILYGSNQPKESEKEICGIQNSEKGNIKFQQYLSFKSLFKKRFFPIAIDTFLLAGATLLLCGNISVLSYDKAKIGVSLAKDIGEEYGLIVDKYTIGRDSNGDFNSQYLINPYNLNRENQYVDTLNYRPLEYFNFNDFETPNYTRINDFPFYRFCNDEENILYGRLPSNVDEILLNKKAYSMCYDDQYDSFNEKEYKSAWDRNVLNELDFNNINYKVVGIIDEEYADVPLFVLNSNHKIFNYSHGTNPIEIYSSYNQNINNQNLIISINESSIATYAPYSEDLNSLTIIKGSYPKSDNEFLVSSSYLKNKKLGISDISNLDLNFDYLDAISSIENYNQLMNEYDYLDKLDSYKIIGVYESTDETIYCTENFYESYVAEKDKSTFTFIRYNYSNFKTFMSNESFFLESSKLHNFNSIRSGLGDSLVLTFIFSGVLFLGSIITTFVDLNHIIKYKKSNIFLLRSYGYREKNIKLSLFAYFSIPLIGSLLLNLILGNSIASLLDKVVIQALLPYDLWNSFNVISFNYFFPVISLIILFLLLLFSIELSFKRIKKELRWYDN